MPDQNKDEVGAGEVFTLEDTAPMLPPSSASLYAEQHPHFRDVFKAHFEADNTLNNAVKFLHRKWLADTAGDPDDDFDVWENISGYEGYARSFIGVESRKEFELVKRQIDEENEARRMMAGASGMANLAAGIANAAVDPITFIPIGGAAYNTYRTTGSILEGAARTAAIGAAAMTAEELTLQAMQETRTFEESAANVAGATFLSGLLGTAGTMFSRSQIDELAKRVDDELQVGGAKSAGAAVAPTTTLEQEGMVGAYGVEKIFKHQDPTIRALHSPSKVTRKTMELLAETGLMRVKNLEEIASEVSVENRIKAANAQKAALFEAVDAEFMKYRGGKSRLVTATTDLFTRSKRDRPLTKGEFDTEVLIASRRFDDPEYTHPIPEVQAAAAHFNKWSNDLKKQAIEVGLFDEDVSVKTAPSHVHRMWDKYKIESNLPDFKAINQQYLIDKRNQQAAAIKPMQEDIIKLRDAIRVRKKEITAIEAETVKGVIDGATKNMRLLVTEALKDIEPPAIAKKTAEEVEAHALKAQESAYIRELRKNIQDELAESVDDALEQEFKSIATAIAKDAEEIGADDLVDFVQSDLLTPMRDAAAQAAASKAERFKLYNENAAIAKSITAYERSLKAQMKKAGEKISDEQALKAFNSKIEAEVRKTARQAARQAAREATEALRKELREMLQDIKAKKKALSRMEFKASFLDEELEAVTTELTNRIIGTPAGRLEYNLKLRSPDYKATSGVGDKALRRGAARERVYDIPDELVEEYLVNDLDAVVHATMRSLIPDIELMRQFGTIDVHPALKAIEDDYRLLSAGQDAKTQKLLNRRMGKDIEDVQAVHDRLRGLYGLPDNYEGKLATAGRIAKRLMYMSKLGGMTISAFADIGKPIMMHGFGRVYGDGIKAFVKNRKSFAASAKEVKEMGVGTDATLDNRLRDMSEMADYQPAVNMVEHVLENMASNFGLITLMSPWNAAMKQFSGVIIQSRILKAVSNYKKLSSKEKAHLAENFIDENTARVIAEQFKKHGRTEDGVLISNNRAWDRTEEAILARDRYTAAVRRDVDRTIVTPGQDKPLWMSRAGLDVIGQFKSFATASVGRTLLLGLQKSDAEALQGMMVMIFLGMQVYAIKNLQAGRELSDDWRVWLSEGIDRSGLVAWLYDANNIAEKLSRGTVGVNALIGGPPMSRYASRSAMEAILGPTYGAAGNMVQVLGAAGAGDWQATDTSALRRLLPYQNLFYIRHLLDKAENAVNAKIGVGD